MHTITLSVSDEAKDKFMWLLSHFSPHEVQQATQSATIDQSHPSGKKMVEWLLQQPALDWSNLGDPVAWQKAQREESSPWESS